MDAFEQYFNREFPRLARAKLSLALDKELDAAQKNLKSLVVEIVTDLQRQVLQTFKFTQARHTPPHSPRAHTPQPPMPSPAHRLAVPSRPPTPPPDLSSSMPSFLDDHDPDFAKFIENSLNMGLYTPTLEFNEASSDFDSAFGSTNDPPLSFDNLGTPL